VTQSLHKAKIRRFARELLKWYEQHGRNLPWRKEGESLYRLVVTEILVQRTKAETVALFYDDFFSLYPDWESLASESLEGMQEALKPIGLWRQRAPRLLALAKEVVAEGGSLPATREGLESKPAIGQYVANAALLFQGVEDAPLLDAGMARVLERCFGPRYLVDIRYDQYLQKLAADVVYGNEAKLLNWAVLDLAALICSVRDPECDECPVVRQCRFAHSRV